jgi:hypothetical protein
MNVCDACEEPFLWRWKALHAADYCNAEWVQERERGPLHCRACKLMAQAEHWRNEAKRCDRQSIEMRVTQRRVIARYKAKSA